MESAKTNVKKVILDTGVFRALVAADSASGVRGLLDLINEMIPLMLVADIGLWPEYVGIKRPPHQCPNLYKDNIKTAKDLNDKQDALLDELITKYCNVVELDPAYIEIMIQTFFSKRVSKIQPEALSIAEDLIYCKGQDFNGKGFTFKGIAMQVALDCAVDEVFYQIRDLPIDSVSSAAVIIHQVTETLKTYMHLPVYRLADSLLEYLFRVHDQKPDDTSTVAKKTIRKAKKNLRELTVGEIGDCMYLWRAVQGLNGSDLHELVTILTFDTQSRKRVTLLIDLLSAKMGSVCLLKNLYEENFLKPGTILVIDPNSFVIKDSIPVNELVAERLGSLPS